MPTIFVADIGGTSSRFGHFDLMPGQEPQLVGLRILPTTGAQSFAELLTQLKDSGFDLSPDQADQTVLAVAGPVRGGLHCQLTNAAWDIDLGTLNAPLSRTVLINDFVAQALGTQTSHAARHILDIQPGQTRPGVVAALGAGTGFGQCALVPVSEQSKRFLPLPSEGGHAPLAFVSRPEFEFLEFLQVRTGQSHGVGDMILCGSGLSLLHAFLTGQELEPAQVAARIGPDSETTAWFARFYGRACQAYALHVLATELFVCGGLAAKNPFLVTHPSFVHEFRACPGYETLLADIPIRLVTALDTGLHGAALYAAMRLHATNR